MQNSILEKSNEIQLLNVKTVLAVRKFTSVLESLGFLKRNYYNYPVTESDNSFVSVMIYSAFVVPQDFWP